MTMDARQALARRSPRDVPEDIRGEMREGEKLLARANISLGIFWKPIAVLVMAFLFFLLAAPLGFFLALVAGVMGVFFYLMRRFMLMVVTNHRLIMRAGILKIDTLQIRLDRIESIEIQRTLVGQFLNYATLIVTGTGTRLAYIPFVENAAQIRNIVDELLYQRDQRPSEPTPLKETIKETSGE